MENIQEIQEIHQIRDSPHQHSANRHRGAQEAQVELVDRVLREGE